MMVNVFVTRIEDEPQTDLLVLPIHPSAVIPPQYRVGWNYYATIDTDDAMFRGIDSIAIETEIAASGFAVVKPQISPTSVR